MSSARENYKELLKRFIKLIAFVDLPINKKFILFSIGVVFWFVVMFVVTIATNIDINRNTTNIVKNIMPYDRVTQKITRKLQSLSIDVTEIMGISEVKVLDQKISTSKEKISDIKSFIFALTQGGQITDLDRNTNKFIENLAVNPINRELDEKYSNNLFPILDVLDTNLDEIAVFKKNILNNTVQGNGQLAEKINEYKQLLNTSISLSNDFSAQAAGLYALNSGKIRNITRFNFYVFAGILVFATVLLGIFTFSISKSFTSPLKSITNQIRALSEGKTDFSKKISVLSKDEIGTLTQDFNDFLDEIHDMIVYKKVIEEDDSLEDVYSRLGNIFSEKFGLDEFILYEISNSQNKMKPVYPVMLSDKDIYCNMDILGNCNLCKVKKTGRQISSTEYPGICKQFRKEIDKLHVCIPMIIGGNIGGVGMFLFDKKYFGLDGDDTRIFKYQQYIKESLSVIEAKRLMSTLRESALKDALTGLYNRRFLQEYTETLVPGVLRRKKSVGLIMCDLDYFKQVNDVYGHSVGDAILKETSSLIKNCVRTSDMVIRFGGEEFLALLVDINAGEAEGLAEKIRKAMEEKKIKVPDGSLKKTISIGVSEFPGDTESFWQAIKYADVALYKAKDAGRNKVIRFTKEMWTEEEF
jgi:diguanylate cyclase (GGDEF)-like protein